MLRGMWPGLASPTSPKLTARHMKAESPLARRLILTGICLVVTAIMLALEGRFDLFTQAETYTQDLRTRRGKFGPARVE